MTSSKREALNEASKGGGEIIGEFKGENVRRYIFATNGQTYILRGLTDGNVDADSLQPHELVVWPGLLYAQLDDEIR